MDDRKFQVVVMVERVDSEGVTKTLEQVGEQVLLGMFETEADADGFVAALPRKPEVN